MPMFDYSCSCGWEGERLVPRSTTPVFCPGCGLETTRVIRSINVVPDSVPGGFVIENLHATPKRYYSKSEYKDDLRANNCRIRDHHVQTMDGSDKNPNCPKWVTLPQDEEARLKHWREVIGPELGIYATREDH